MYHGVNAVGVAYFAQRGVQLVALVLSEQPRLVRNAGMAVVHGRDVTGRVPRWSEGYALGVERADVAYPIYDALSIVPGAEIAEEPVVELIGGALGIDINDGSGGHRLPAALGGIHADEEYDPVVALADPVAVEVVEVRGEHALLHAVGGDVCQDDDILPRGGGDLG